MNKKLPHIKIYHGYGYAGKMLVYGHVFKGSPPRLLPHTNNNFLFNLRQLLKLFFINVQPFARIRLEFEGEILENKTEYDGFFRFYWTPKSPPEPGWHQVKVSLIEESGHKQEQAEGKVFVIRESRYVFISDVDDTVIKSYSSTVLRRVYELLSRNLLKRKTFEGVVDFYNRLSEVHTEIIPNPFFYVSSSEWNLYDYLKALFRHNHLPEGVFLLNQVKTLSQVLKTGKTGHQGKQVRILRVMDTLPVQKMVLIGDNSQKDPWIYAEIAEKYPDRIFAIFIRNVRSSRQQTTEQVLGPLAALGVHCLQFNHSQEAIAYSERIFKSDTP